MCQRTAWLWGEMTKPKVHVERWEELSHTRTALKKSLEALDWKSIVKPNDQVVIKVNGTHFTYLEGLTTTPELVYEFVRLLKTRAGEVIVGESNLQRVSAEEALMGCGIQKAAEKAGARVVNFSSLPMRSDIEGEYMRGTPLPKLYSDCDVFCSMPVFKTHKLTGVTLTLKNHFGCHPDDLRLKHHGDIHKVLSDITGYIKPRLVVMDGRIGLESDGPIAGLPKKLGLLLTSTNCVAADSTACRIMGFDPSEIKHIAHAHGRGLGPLSLDQINYTGPPIKDITDPFERANQDSISALEKWLSNKPRLSKLVYRTFFNQMKWISWKIRWASGYKKEYVRRIEERGIWKDYEGLFH